MSSEFDSLISKFGNDLLSQIKTSFQKLETSLTPLYPKEEIITSKDVVNNADVNFYKIFEFVR